MNEAYGGGEGSLLTLFPSKGEGAIFERRGSTEDLRFVYTLRSPERT